MDKRQLVQIFAERLAHLLATDTEPTAHFLRQTGIDRSALSQFLDNKTDRLPRAETLRRIASSCGVSIDWLLGLENAPEGRQEIAPSLHIEQARLEDGTTPLDNWRKEAHGHKLRYVPSTLPDLMGLSEIPLKTPIYDPRGGGVENVLEGASLGQMDVEIAMPIQTLQDLSAQSGLWRGANIELCRRQLLIMAQTCKTAYPSLRLHLYDGSKTFSAPFSVFGRIRAAIYVGEAYMTVTSPEQVQVFSDRFDELVRRTIVSPDKVHETLENLAQGKEP
jgi:transcriptional regulator with XRE-family HTH domain